VGNTCNQPAPLSLPQRPSESTSESCMSPASSTVRTSSGSRRSAAQRWSAPVRVSVVERARSSCVCGGGLTHQSRNRQRNVNSFGFFVFFSRCVLVSFAGGMKAGACVSGRVGEGWTHRCRRCFALPRSERCAPAGPPRAPPRLAPLQDLASQRRRGRLRCRIGIFFQGHIRKLLLSGRTNATNLTNDFY
jgi:hypothetical protein